MAGLLKASHWIFIGLIYVIISGCNKYKKKNGSVYYYSWNEANGGNETELDVHYDEFKVLKYDRYAKDDQQVFFDGRKIEDADAKSFEAVAEFFGHDKNRGYYAGDSIESSRGKTFRLINSYYSTDGHDVFFMQKPLHVVSAKDFRFVYDSGEQGWERWTTDGHYYYIKQMKVPSNDYQHMTLYKNSGGLSKDNKWVYFQGRKLNYDDSGKKIVDTIDVASFKVTGYVECRDKYGCFNVFHGREECKPESNIK